MIECIGQNSVVPDLATTYIIFRVGTSCTYPLFLKRRLSVPDLGTVHSLLFY